MLVRDPTKQNGTHFGYPSYTGIVTNLPWHAAFWEPFLTTTQLPRKMLLTSKVLQIDKKRILV